MRQVRASAAWTSEKTRLQFWRKCQQILCEHDVTPVAAAHFLQVIVVMVSVRVGARVRVGVRVTAGLRVGVRVGVGVRARIMVGLGLGFWFGARVRVRVVARVRAGVGVKVGYRVRVSVRARVRFRVMVGVRVVDARVRVWARVKFLF